MRVIWMLKTEDFYDVSFGVELFPNESAAMKRYDEIRATVDDPKSIIGENDGYFELRDPDFPDQCGYRATVMGVDV